MSFVRAILRLVLPSLADGLPAARLLTGACLLFAFGVSTMGQQPQPSGWEWQNPLPQGNTINCVRFAADKRNGWAVGSDGAILRTRNGGFEWDSQLSPATTTLYGIYVKDKSRAVISGARGVILTTDKRRRQVGRQNDRHERSSVRVHVRSRRSVARLGRRKLRRAHRHRRRRRHLEASEHPHLRALFSVAFFDAKIRHRRRFARHAARDHERRRRMAARTAASAICR